MNDIKIQDILPDVIIEMTPQLYQEFCIGGCIPMCHLTLEYIKIGDKFKLSTISKNRTVMLCESSDIKEYKKIKDTPTHVKKTEKKKGGGCFVENGKIVL